jgi:hypothetical protein
MPSTFFATVSKAAVFGRDDHLEDLLRPVLFIGNMLPMLIDAAGDQARMRFLEFFTVAWSPSSESRMNSGRATVVVPSLASHQTSRIGVDSKWPRKNPPRLKRLSP